LSDTILMLCQVTRYLRMRKRRKNRERTSFSTEMPENSLLKASSLNLIWLLVYSCPISAFSRAIFSSLTTMPYFRFHSSWTDRDALLLQQTLFQQHCHCDLCAAISELAFMILFSSLPRWNLFIFSSPVHEFLIGRV